MTDELSLQKVTHEELLDLCERNIENGLSVFIEGGIGIGKSDTAELLARRQAAKMKRKFVCFEDLLDHEREELVNSQEAREKVYIFVIYDLLTKAPEDGAGIPVPRNGYIDWMPPCSIRIMTQPGAAGLMFLDEFLQAPQSVQKPYADLFLNGRIAERRIMPEVGVIGASNLAEDKCGTTQMLDHMDNRTAHYELLTPTAKKWVSWCQEQERNLGMKDEEGKSIPFVDPRILMFIMSCPDQLYVPKRGDRKRKGFPSPRVWRRVSPVIRTVNEETDKMLFLHILAGWVGNGATAKFKGVLDHNMAEEGPKILDDPELFRSAKWDRQVAFSMWMSNHSRNDSKFMHRSCRFLNSLGRSPMFDTMVYMMKSNVGKTFITACSGGRYPVVREVLLEMGLQLKEDAE